MIGLRGEKDDAVDRFQRSLDVFGFTSTLADLSSYGFKTQDVEFESIVRTLRKQISYLTDEYVLILDGLVSSTQKV